MSFGLQLPNHILTPKNKDRSVFRFLNKFLRMLESSVNSNFLTDYCISINMQKYKSNNFLLSNHLQSHHYPFAATLPHTYISNSRKTTTYFCLVHAIYQVFSDLQLSNANKSLCNHHRCSPANIKLPFETLQLQRN